MDESLKYLRYAFLFPVIALIIVSVIMIPILYHGNTMLTIAQFIWPTPGYTYITSPFGKRSSPTVGASSYHQGIDIGAREGSKILAINSGKVTFTGWNSSGGNMIIIEHAGGIDSRYCHLGEVFLVKTGDIVMKGQTIATVGPLYLSNGKKNGATTGPHLHLGIRKDGEFVNPLLYLFPL